MISNCIFTWAITSQPSLMSHYLQLWIDFKLYFYVSNHKLRHVVCYFNIVVNWFQIVFLREQSQAIKYIAIRIYCCELISNCIFTWAITRMMNCMHYRMMLWIDFKLYFYVSNHKYNLHQYPANYVVNWFQIVFLREQSQVRAKHNCRQSCCELISNCIFTWAITSMVFIYICPHMLWIDFKLYFYVSNHKE